MVYFRFSLRVLAEQGFFEIALLSLLILYNHHELRPVLTLSVLTLEFLMASAGRAMMFYLLGLIGTIVMFFTGHNDMAYATAFTSIFKLAFERQNYFQCSIFATAFSLSRFVAFQSPLVFFLIRLIEIQVCFLGLFKTDFLKNKNYILIWAINIIMAICSIHPLELHRQIIESSHLWYVLILGGLSLVMLFGLTWSLDRLSKKTIPNILKRKLFHIPPLILFPLLDYHAHSLFIIALVGAFYVLFVLEILRYFYRLQERSHGGPIVQLWQWMTTFVDKRDQHLWVTHLSLYAGMMVTYFSNQPYVIRNMSVILPIGDAFAALIGYYFGRIRIRGKSLEGLIGFIVSTIIIFLALEGFYHQSVPLTRVLMAVGATGLVQLLSKQVDNLLLPMMFLQVYKALRQ